MKYILKKNCYFSLYCFHVPQVTPIRWNKKVLDYIYMLETFKLTILCYSELYSGARKAQRKSAQIALPTQTLF